LSKAFSQEELARIQRSTNLGERIQVDAGDWAVYLAIRGHGRGREKSSHFDRPRLKVAGDLPLRLDAWQRRTYGSVVVEALPAYNSNHNRASSLGFLIEIDGKKIYHARDTSFTPEMEALGARGIDVALLPCDGFSNRGPVEAEKCAHAKKVAYSGLLEMLRSYARLDVKLRIGVNFGRAATSPYPLTSSGRSTWVGRTRYMR
jgi:hypothetical protein